jgi:hypothetical protein
VQAGRQEWDLLEWDPRGCRSYWRLVYCTDGGSGVWATSSKESQAWLSNNFQSLGGAFSVGLYNPVLSRVTYVKH